MSCLLAVAMMAVSFAGCGSGSGGNGSSDNSTETVVKVASRYDNDKIWEAVNKVLEPEHIRVECLSYDSSVNLNDLLLAGDVDINVAQHYNAIDYFKASNSKYDDLVALGEIGISTIDLYSNKFDSVEELPDGALIAIPNDAMNGGRALNVLKTAGLIDLNDDYTGYPGQENIIDNPKHFTFTEIASSSMISILDDVDAGFAYSNNAVDAGLDPNVDPILQDELDLESNEGQRGYVIVFTGVKGDENNEVYKKVIDAYHTDEVYKVYKEVYKGASVPVDNGTVIDLSQY